MFNSRERYQPYKKGSLWKVKLPHGTETFRTKGEATEKADLWKKANSPTVHIILSEEL